MLLRVIKHNNYNYPIAFGNPATVPRISAACQPTCSFHVQCSSVFLKKCIPERPPMSRNIAIFFLKICTRKRGQIRPDGTQMSKKSWFGGVLGPCGGVLEPSGPENPPGCILGCENHVRGSPLGDAFWYNSRVFLCFFLLFFRPCAQNGILWIFMRF